MLSHFNQRATSLVQPQHTSLLSGILRGIEKESLRITPQGELAQTPHPYQLGAALTHPRITTDYSEALLEFITEPNQDVSSLLQQLEDVHRFTYANIGDESLWVTSMPCMLGDDDHIPVGRYGTSNVGRMKTVYRLGLGHRYGRLMQTIAGIHYNFSLPDSFWEHLHQQEQSKLSLQDFKTQRYFDLIRNFRRYFWLLIYLFGAAPAVCRTFVRGREHNLQPFEGDVHSLHAPYGTSLRMGNLGYQSSAQKELIVCYNNMDAYLKTLCGAITSPHSAYENIGLKGEQNNYQQLNTSLLQIENEFYSTIRPKRTAQSGETALSALHKRGVEYIEVRCVDLNPYEPLGINAEQIHLLDSFLLFCLLKDSPETDEVEYRHMQENQKRIVERGRDPELTLINLTGEKRLDEWGSEMLDDIAVAAKLLDQGYDSQDYSRAVEAQRAKLGDPELTPSARILRDMKEQNVTFFRLAMNLAKSHKQAFNEKPLSADTKSQFVDMASQSIADQQAIEAEDEGSFDDYLSNYYAQYQCCD